MKRVTTERNKRGWSQAELARRAGINASSMSRIEKGIEPAYPRRGKKIADALGWEGEPSELFEDEQVIATTLGRGTGEWVLEHSGTLYDKWRCSKCGYLFIEPRCDQGYTDLEPNFCPKCGVDFREEGDCIRQ